MPTFSVQGVDRQSGQQRWERIEAPNESMARAAANAMGVEVSNVGLAAPKMNYASMAAARGNGPKIRALGLSRGEAWVVAILGGLSSPAIIGIPLLIWGIMAERRVRELQQQA